MLTSVGLSRSATMDKSSMPFSQNTSKYCVLSSLCSAVMLLMRTSPDTYCLTSVIFPVYLSSSLPEPPLADTTMGTGEAATLAAQCCSVMSFSWRSNTPRIVSVLHCCNRSVLSVIWPQPQLSCSLLNGLLPVLPQT